MIQWHTSCCSYSEFIIFLSYICHSISIIYRHWASYPEAPQIKRESRQNIHKTLTSVLLPQARKCEPAPTGEHTPLQSHQTERQRTTYCVLPQCIWYKRLGNGCRPRDNLWSLRQQTVTSCSVFSCTKVCFQETLCFKHFLLAKISIPLSWITDAPC